MKRAADVAMPMTRAMFVPAVAAVSFIGIGVLGMTSGTWIPVTVGLVLAVTFSAERIAPYSLSWNRRRPTIGPDATSAAVNELLTILGILIVPIAGSVFSLGVWPTDAPRAVKLVVAVIVLDAGVTGAHWWSHRQAALWRFHAVHHSADRLYGLNGLMKHPVHLLFETAVGMTPLILMGIDSSTAAALAGLVAVQLVLQHANVDYRVGRLGRWFAWNAGHRLHHVADETQANVNFGLFTLVWDRVLGTYREPPVTASSPIVGLANRMVPSRYLEQLAMPWDALSGAEDRRR